MPSNAKLRWFLLIPIIIGIFVFIRDFTPSLLQKHTREIVPPSITFDSIDPTKVIKVDSYQTFIRGKVTDNEGER